MRYVHVAQDHHRELPAKVRAAAMGVPDPDTRVLRMLGARGSHVAAEASTENEKAAIRLPSSCEWGDSNPHDVTHWYLKPARLPIPPHSRFQVVPGGTVLMP